MDPILIGISFSQFFETKKLIQRNFYSYLTKMDHIIIEVEDLRLNLANAIETIRTLQIIITQLSSPRVAFINPEEVDILISDTGGS